MVAKAYVFLILLLLVACSLHAAQETITFDGLNATGEIESPWDGYSNTKGTLSIAAGAGFGGTDGLKFTVPGGLGYGMGPTLEFRTDLAEMDTANGVYTRFQIKWTTPGVGGVKFLKHFGFISTGYSNVTYNYGPVADEAAFLTSLCFGDGTSIQNDTAICIKPYTTAISEYYTIAQKAGVNFIPQSNVWYTVETYSKQNSVGNSDGEFWIKVDGSYLLLLTNVVNAHADNARGYQKITFGDYVNAYASMEYVIDNVSIGNAPIVIGGDTSPDPEEPITTTSGPILRTGTHLLRVGDSVLRVQ